MLTLQEVLKHYPTAASIVVAKTAAQVLELIRSEKPGVAIVNHRLRDVSSIGLAKEIVRDSPQTRILFVSIRESWSALASAVKTGAKGFLLESDSGELATVAVDALRAGYAYFSPLSALILTNEFAKISEQPRIAKLSRRQLEILTRLAVGQRNKVIADQLQISVKTVEAHRARMMGKLAVHSTVELIRWVIEEGVLDGKADDPRVMPH
jgi:two-component system response regulator NreC